jgi:hypothetical protein
MQWFIICTFHMILWCIDPFLRDDSVNNSCCWVTAGKRIKIRGLSLGNCSVNTFPRKRINVSTVYGLSLGNRLYSNRGIVGNGIFFVGSAPGLYNEDPRAAEDN